jgi:hypothetical protein
MCQGDAYGSTSSLFMTSCGGAYEERLHIGAELHNFSCRALYTAGCASVKSRKPTIGDTPGLASTGNRPRVRYPP